MPTKKILSTRLFEALIMAAVLFGGYTLVLQADISHIKDSQQQQLDMYKDLTSQIDKNRDSISNLRIEIYKHNHPKK